VVGSGIIFHKALYIPLDAVVKRAGTDVFINMPKLVVGMMPWSEPPTKAERQEKQGPPAITVTMLYGSRSPSEHEADARR